MTDIATIIAELERVERVLGTLKDDAEDRRQNGEPEYGDGMALAYQNALEEIRHALKVARS